MVKDISQIKQTGIASKQNVNKERMMQIIICDTEKSQLDQK